MRCVFWLECGYIGVKINGKIEKTFFLIHLIKTNQMNYIEKKEQVERSWQITRNEITSICIPRIESSICREYIYTTFQNLKIGHIERMNEIPLRNDPTHKRIIIRIRLNNSELAYDIKHYLDELGSVKIVHNMPWFWKVVKGSTIQPCLV